MAKRIAPPAPLDKPDYLVKSKNQFEIELDDRIHLGEDFLARQISSGQELAKLNRDYSFWHDYNAELLKRAFDRTNNQYFKDYIQTPAFFMTSMFGETPTFEESLNDTRNDWIFLSKVLHDSSEMTPIIPGQSTPPI